MNDSEQTRYSRQIRLPEMGLEGQSLIRKARVLVVGAGGLGCPALLYLTAAGVGNIGIVDDDIVELSNLQRQVLFDEADIGKAKADTAARKLMAKNSGISVEHYSRYLRNSNAVDLIRSYDIVVDCTDNFPARYLINDVCALLKKPMVSGALHRFEGQVAVFNHGTNPVSYRDVFPQPPEEYAIPSCDEAGVLGVLPGMIGTLQASEVIKLVTGIGEPLAGRMFLVDLKTMTTSILQLEANTSVRLNAPSTVEEIHTWDYDGFCGSGSGIPEIDSAQLSGGTWQLIDVRDLDEYDPTTDPEAIRIPLRDLPSRASLLNPSVPTVVFCQSGVRSLLAVTMLRDEFGFQEIFSLKGGVNAFAASGVKGLSEE